MVFLEIEVAGLNSEFSALRHGVPRIEDEIDDDLLNLNRVNHDAAQRRIQRVVKLDVLVDQPGQKPFGFRYDGVEIHNLGMKNLPPAEGQQLASQGGGTVRCFSNLRHTPNRRISRLERFRQKLCVPIDHAEQVVEVVRQTSRESSDGLELLRLANHVL